MRDDTLQRVQAWLKEHADCAGHEFDLCALVDSAIIDAMPKPDAWKGQDDKLAPKASPALRGWITKRAEVVPHTTHITSTEGEAVKLCDFHEDQVSQCGACEPSTPSSGKETVVWADEASPFTGAQVKDLLEENERLRLKTVFVMAYNHKHGEDISVYSTAELAVQSACDIIEQYIEDVQDEAAKAAIKLALVECAWDKVLELWSTYQNQGVWQAEDITIYKKEVCGGE